MVSGATKEHQASCPLHTLGMRWDVTVPWAMIGLGWLDEGKGLKVGGPTPVLALGFDPFPGVEDKPFLVAFFLGPLCLPTIRGVFPSELTLVLSAGNLGTL